jgi:hypothetical protein
VLGFIVTAGESDAGYGGYGYGYGYDNRPSDRPDHAGQAHPAPLPVHPDAGSI